MHKILRNIDKTQGLPPQKVVEIGTLPGLDKGENLEYSIGIQFKSVEM
jgi:hypothetical protein